MKNYITAGLATLILSLTFTASVQMVSVTKVNVDSLETDMSNISHLDSSLTNASDTTSTTWTQRLTSKTSDSSQAPEPAILLLFGTGLAALAGIIKSKKH